MPILFEEISSLDVPSTTEIVVLVALDARSTEIAAGDSETTLDIILSMLGEAEQIDEGEVAPEIPTMAWLDVIVTIDSVLALHIATETELTVDLSIDGYFGEAGDSFTELVITPSFNAYMDLSGDNYGFLVEQPAVITALDTSIVYETIEDLLLLGVDSESLDTAVMVSGLLAGSAPSSRFEGSNTVEASVGLTDAFGIIYRELVALSLALGVTDVVDYRAIGLMVDRLVVTGIARSALEAQQLVATSLVFGDSVSNAWRDLMADLVEFDTSQADSLTAMHEMVDEALFGVVDETVATLHVLIPESLVFDSDAVTVAELMSTLRDQVAFVLRLQVDNGEYTAWTVNTATAGHSRYSNYPFNGFMQLGSKYYGTSEEGLYLLEGSSDDGVAIAAKIRAGMSKLGNSNMKSIQSMYLGYRANGNLQVKVILADGHNGRREAHVYDLVERGGGSQREQRVPIGRGLQSVYWDYEISNVAGVEFDIDTVEILPLVHERRVRGSSGGKA